MNSPRFRDFQNKKKLPEVLNMFWSSRTSRLWLSICLLVVLSLASGGVPGPCRHSVMQDHLQSLGRLIDNQLDHSCFIQYPFTEHLNLSTVCYVKAALPQALELLSKHFHYVRSSDNRRYVSALQKLIYHLYTQGCVAEIDEEVEDSPVRFSKAVESSPKDALKKVQGVFQMYMNLMRDSKGPVDWDCRAEFTVEEDYQTTTTADSGSGHKPCLP
ncbi:macrophage colony-stimulating factor 1-like [Sphaeramia orbicularis]|uniref:macrophage colony-stimulating factor 1-like n=1 Tax=Sphaeramia orbicularis TaxID=375764 RepID=UPI00117FEC1F|nr:macrophage colony-stimulating factor 1-like [Sphaeramia orbicularis]